LLQLASMFSTQRSEFVNTMRRNWAIRFDDPYFINGDREKIRAETPFELLGWTRDDVKKFDEALSSSEVVISSLFAATGWTYFESRFGVRRRIDGDMLDRMLKQSVHYFIRTFNNIRLNHQQRFDLVKEALDRMIRDAPSDAIHVTLGAGTRAFGAQTGKLADVRSTHDAYSQKDQLALRLAYNNFLRDYCVEQPRCLFFDLDEIVGFDDLAGVEAGTGRALPDHYNRQAYVAIARELKKRVQAVELKSETMPEQPRTEDLATSPAAALRRLAVAMSTRLLSKSLASSDSTAT